MKLRALELTKATQLDHKFYINPDQIAWFEQVNIGEPDAISLACQLHMTNGEIVVVNEAPNQIALF